MKPVPIDPELFVANRERLRGLLPKNALVVVNSNDILPTNADGTLPLRQNSDLFYLTGIDQEETIILLAPDAVEEKNREILFVRETNEDLARWEGHKLTQDEASKISGIKSVRWLPEFRGVFHALMCVCDEVFLNMNEHARATVEVETRDARFVRDTQRRYPLHSYRRLAPLMRRLRVVKSEHEIALIREAAALTERGFRRALRFVKPGVNEAEIEAEFAHEFIRNKADFAYPPIIAGGANACVLHYIANDRPCKKGDLLLLDVAAARANYASDLTRTIPVSGKFSKRQKQVYNAVLRVLRASIDGAVVGKLHREWQKEAQAMMNDELLQLGLLKPRDIKKQTPDNPACKKYFMHGLGHPIGLDVHDVADLREPMQPGWVLTVEPGIYIPDERLGVRLENDILITEKGAVDLMADVPIEAEEIEESMNR
jgi:Xaa-Pro aminopeptidase